MFLALEKVNYKDNETVITARNLNAIQDEIIYNRQLIDELGKQPSAPTTTIIDATVE